MSAKAYPVKLGKGITHEIGMMKSNPRPLSWQSVVNTSIRLFAALPPLKTTKRRRVAMSARGGGCKGRKWRI